MLSAEERIILDPMQNKSTAAPSAILVRGARQNNLDGLDLDIPNNMVTAVTGVSGSGKSSLAIDTLFAEGQWRYLESLPAYARMLMEKASRPKVDTIHNIRPAIGLERINTIRTGRSTVSTLTELQDLFALLFSACGAETCVSCGGRVDRWTHQTVADLAVELGAGRKLTVEAELATSLGEGWSQTLIGKGFARARIAGEIVLLDSPDLPPHPAEGTMLVVDRIKGVPERVGRIAQSVETARKLEERAGGEVVIRIEGGDPLVFPDHRGCVGCNKPAIELTPLTFHFNHALGACPVCSGFGAELVWDEDKIVPDPTLSIADGAIDPWKTPASKWWRDQLTEHGPGEGVDLEAPWFELSEKTRLKLWRGSGPLEGIEDFFDYLETKRYKMHVRVFMARYRSPKVCTGCGGGRFNPEVLSVRVGGLNIAELCALDLGSLAQKLPALRDEVGEAGREPLWRIEEKVGTLLKLGLHYLTPDRLSQTLSGGETQRVGLARHLSHKMTETLFIVDEPSTGLHRVDSERLSGLLGELADRGNTVVMVEHDLGLISGASHVVELGPGGGREGGRIVYEGSPEKLADEDTPTGRWMAKREFSFKPTVREPKGWVKLTGCDLHNLRDLDVSFPMGVLACVTGVSGSGKTSLVTSTLAPALSSKGGRFPGASVEMTPEWAEPAVKLVTQEPMGRTPRSIPLTYLSAYTPIRELLASQHGAAKLGLTPASFSFNVKGGRCERCQGAGFEKIEMLFFEDVFAPCESCNGKRFRPEVLTVRYKGKNIHDILTMTVDEAAAFFADMPKLEKPLDMLKRMGLGYLVVGQPATTLSGGEAQRLKIGAELLTRSKGGTLYVLDEPTSGLHPADVEMLAGIVDELVDRGNTVVAVEHNLGFIASADWVIDLGPGGGSQGGEIVDTGPPADVAARGLGPTGRCLNEGEA